ncbi:MAG: dihydrolipoyl dehydrogenase [Rhabdochlamydiaceae bacterium]|nr:dihydrolipoyl dehydrogenase [Rhabdochlamydiaceae bacterium]
MQEEFDVVVIGAGPAGYVAAIRCAQLGLKTACIEKRETLGGTCLNVGCIPSKTLLYASELYYNAKNKGKSLGLLGESLSFDWKIMQERKGKVIQGLNEGAAGLFKKNKVVRIQGEASFETPHLLLVRTNSGDQKISARFFIIATGSLPTELPFLPFDEKKVLSSTGALSISEIPKRLAVIGAGVIGVELGSVFQRLGSQVTFIEFMDRICPQFDPAISSSLQESLTKQGMKFQLQSKVTSAKIESVVELSVSPKDGAEQIVQADAVLVAVGRKPYTEGLGLEKIGLTLTAQGLLQVNSNFATAHPHILAIGDVIDGPMLAHKASEEGVAAAEICAGKSPTLQYITIPNVIYTSPEVASVGFSEADLTQRGISFLSASYSFKGNSRARCMGEDEGFIKVLADKQTDAILGIHMIGPHASELIAEAVLALGKSAEEVGHLCHAHPTLSESLKEALLSLHKKAIHK